MGLSRTGKVLLWLYGALAAALGGVGTAVAAVVGGAVVGALDFTWRQLGVVAIGGAIAAAAGYLKESPLPDLRGTYPGNEPLPK